MQTTKIAIIGAGAVGSTIAYTLAQRNAPAQILLIDTNKERCQGEILDLSDSLAFCKTSTIVAGSMKDAQKCDIIIIAAGIRQKVGQTRIALLKENQKIIKDIITALIPLKESAIIIMVSNPVDILTHEALKLAKLPASRVFGSGTLLDSMRLRELIGAHLNVWARSVHAYILGEHGDTQFPAWSISSIGGVPILEYPNIDIQLLDQFANQARDRAYEIIKLKGSTFYGVASCVASMCENIIYDQKALAPISCFVKEFNVCLSVPCVLDKNGIQQQPHIRLNQHEQELLKKSAHTIASLASGQP